MATTDLSEIKIRSFNCKGFKPRNYNYLRDLFKDSSILLLQEHWLFNFECDLICKILNDASYHAKSSMNDKELLKGRPYGGTAIVYRNNIKAKVNPLSTSTPRLCAVSMESEDYNIVVICVYMPTDVPEHNNEFIEVLDEISSFYQQYSDHEFIIGGDFNCDERRGNERSALLRAWRLSLGVLSPALQPDAPPNLHTFRSHDGRTALLDYVFASEGLHGDLAEWKVSDDGDNLSDHLPVTAVYKRSIRFVAAKQSEGGRPQWFKADSEKIAMYKERLNVYLNNIMIPVEAANCNNFIGCNDDHNDKFREFLHAIIDACQRATADTIPLSRGGASTRRGPVPGWNDAVRDARATSIWWHERWKECGRPREGWVAQIRRRTRAQYHQAIKTCMSDRDDIIKVKISNNLKNGTPKEFWNHISKLSKKKSGTCAIIDDRVGDDACNAFYDKYNKLYNSNPSKNINELRVSLSTNILNQCCVGNDHSCHMHEVSCNMVKIAIKKLKKDQYDDYCKLMSDSLIHGTDKLFVLLSVLYTIMIRHGYDDKVLNTVTLVPIPKDKKKSLSNSDNYRAIAPNNVLMKLLDYIILKRFGYAFQTSDSQFAYKPEFSPSMCSYIASETIQYYMRGGHNVYAVLLDCSKAFDVVRYDELFHALISRGMCHLVARLILNLYTTTVYCVRWNGVLSETFNISNGVKQGGVTSPFLFTICMEALITKIKSHKIGCYVGDRNAAIFVFADDILLLCPTRSSAQKLLDECYDFAEEVGLKFNAGKCKVIVYGNNRNLDVQLKMGEENLKIVNEEYHIGHLLTDSKNGPMIDHKDTISGIGSKTNCLVRTFPNIGTDAKSVLFNAQCCNLFGIELIDINNKQFDSICIKWRKCVRYVLNISPRTHNDFLPMLIESPSIQYQIYSRILSFFYKGYHHKSSYVSFFFRNSLVSLSSYMSRNVYNIANRINTNFCEIIRRPLSWVKNKCKPKLEYDWRINMIKELLSCRDGTLQCNLSKLEIVELMNTICTI